jgi:oxygen-dependent protoporphyrinogen oxidase
MKVVVVGGGIAGLAAARRLETLLPEAEVVLVEQEPRLGGKLLTERVDGFLVEGAPDSFLSRKERGVQLCEELGLGDELFGRRAENARSYVRRATELHPLPEGLTGVIPTNLDALAGSALLSPEGRERLAAEVDLAPAPPGGDESIAAFVSRRLGREAYEQLVEPLMTGIYGGDGEQLSVEATFPNLRRFELEHGSLLRGLAVESGGDSGYPAFLSLRGGMDRLVIALTNSLERTHVFAGTSATSVRGLPGQYAVDVGHIVEADGVVIAAPAFATSKLLFELNPELAELLAGIPYASSAIVTIAYRREDVPHPLDGFGYVVPSAEGSDVLACTWTSSKWEGRAPEGFALFRVYAGRFGGRDVTRLSDDRLVELARDEVRVLGISGQLEPALTRIHRWPQAMPQYVLGHPERLGQIESALTRHPGLALAGAAYHGVGIPDCIRSGEQAAQAMAESLARVPG